nr:cytochrome P450 4V2-like [Rhipicephalus microplus]
MRRVNCYLVDAAKTWFENRESTLQSWDVFRTTFLRTFTSFVHKERAATILETRVQLPNKNITVFVKEMTQLFHHADSAKAEDEKILRSRKKAYKIEESQHGAKKQSFMDILLRMHMEEGVFTLDEIREEVNTFMIGGFDTTAMAASYAIHLLGNHPEVQAKVHEELDAVFGSDEKRPVTAEDIKQLKYLGCVIKQESLAAISGSVVCFSASYKEVRIQMRWHRRCCDTSSIRVNENLNGSEISEKI